MMNPLQRLIGEQLCLDGILFEVRSYVVRAREPYLVAVDASGERIELSIEQAISKLVDPSAPGVVPVPERRGSLTEAMGPHRQGPR